MLAEVVNFSDNAFIFQVLYKGEFIPIHPVLVPFGDAEANLKERFKEMKRWFIKARRENKNVFFKTRALRKVDDMYICQSFSFITKSPYKKTGEYLGQF